MGVPGRFGARGIGKRPRSVTGCVLQSFVPTRPAMSSRAASFTSKTAWEALGVESGEETEEEVLDEATASQPERYDA